MNPANYVSEVYTKAGRVKELEKADEGWVPLYLNKLLIHDKDNAHALSRCTDYCLYLSPNSYYYLLCCVIPKKLAHETFFPKKKTKDDGEDVLHVRVREALGWSQREFDRHKNIIERTILNDRSYWEKQFGL